ncbi:sel1 repeat family protein [Caenimonas sedimenti]|uniref:Sel1 repeat family protein n=1 Tax=Caenimonas sedimenti TaxID=2596921 RepID=A0A562ZUY3_9BURK|nr:tetratricopeptide repeat protein [Caenimonas sedimenti]TWO72176.1 sel1 repeat family protein [Caenimonas sedimenti]
MSLNFQALGTLAAWELQAPLQGGIAFESLLRRCQLDYSLASLDRVDTLLLALRKTQKLQAASFLESDANRNLLLLLAFYMGELLGRGLRRPPTWFTYEQLVAADPGLQATIRRTFLTSMACRFPGTDSKVDFVMPMQVVAARLFAPEAAMQSLRANAALVFNQDAAQARLPLPPLPPQHLGIPLQAGPVKGRLNEEQPVTMERPGWVARDKLQFLFDCEEALLRGGRVVWAALVQAEPKLSLPAATHGGAPGELLYDPQGRTAPADLAAVAKAVLALKGEKPADPALAAFCAHLADEKARVFGLAVPAALSAHPLKTSSTYFDRRHLPGARLSGLIFPAVISDAHPGAVLLLPLPLWPEALRKKSLPPKPAATPPPVVDAEALFQQGLKHAEGKGAAEDPERAHELWLRAAAAGHIGAVLEVALQYANGIGVERDMPLAIAYYLEAAEQGHAGAQFSAGKLLLMKNEPSYNRKEAAVWLKRAAEQGSEEAAKLLAQHGLEGEEKPGLLRRLISRKKESTGSTKDADDADDSKD